MKGILIFTIYVVANLAHAGEPVYCDPAQFSKFEVQYSGRGPKNLRVFKIGKLTLAGMAIGYSDAADVAKTATTYGNATSANNYCTWYLNNGNSEAEKNFTWIDLPKPSGSNYQSMGDQYISLIGGQFDEAEVSFVSCALNTGYVGIGCNAQHHRGPSVFAMILGYAGCSPQHAAAIANKIWGTNGIKPQMREALAQRASELADLNQEKSQQFKNLMK